MFLLIIIAFVSGVLTVFSPCVLPILPIILTSGIDGKISRIRGVIFGLVLSFTLSTLLLAVVVNAFNISIGRISDLAALFLMMIATTMIFPSTWERIQFFIEKFWKIKPIQNKNDGFFGGIITGISLGIVWTPCIGPLIATVATLSAINSFSVFTILITISYSLGTSVPLYYIAKGGSVLTRKFSIINQNNQKIRAIFGVVILLTAILIFTDGDKLIQSWVISHLPEFVTQPVSIFENKLNINQKLQIFSK